MQYRPVYLLHIFIDECHPDIVLAVTERNENNLSQPLSNEENTSRNVFFRLSPKGEDETKFTNNPQIKRGN